MPPRWHGEPPSHKQLIPPSLLLVEVGAARALGGKPPPSEQRTTIGRKTLARVASVERAHTQIN